MCIRDSISTIGLFNAKAKNVIATCRILVDQYAGEVPRDRDALEAVSYTHLDVYKRQTGDCGVLP